MIVTYEGDADQGMVDGILFPRGVPVEVDDAQLDRFSSLEGYTVDGDEPAVVETDNDDNEMEVMHDGDGSL